MGIWGFVPISTLTEANNHHEEDEWYAAVQQEAQPVVIVIEDISDLKLYDEITDERLKDPKGSICYTTDPIAPELITIKDLSHLIAAKNGGKNED